MNVYEIWIMAWGALTPTITATIQQPRFVKYRWLIRILFNLGSATVWAYSTNQLDLQNWFKTVALVLGAAVLVEYGILKPTNITPKIEEKTNFLPAEPKQVVLLENKNKSQEG